ncbi:transposase InsO family protein [Bradyrhizobium sp. CIR18]|nr:transposase InsO family protein [Bradyrhizobium sp. CIR18]
MSERQACPIAGAYQKMIHYCPAALRTRSCVARCDLANEAAFRLPGCFVLLRRKGEPPGINRIYRLCREEGLTVRKRRAPRKAAETRAPILIEARPNARWSLDFVHTQFVNGRRFRILNVVDVVTKECPGRHSGDDGKPGMIVSRVADYNIRRPHSSLKYLSPAA